MHTGGRRRYAELAEARRMEGDARQVRRMALEAFNRSAHVEQTVAVKVHQGGLGSIHDFNSHASSTPASDGRNLYVAFLHEALEERAPAYVPGEMFVRAPRFETSTYVRVLKSNWRTIRLLRAKPGIRETSLAAASRNES